MVTPDQPYPELVTTRSQLQEVASSTQEFLATLSYAVRTPLNGLIGMAQLALDTPLAAEQREYIVSTATAAESLLKALTDILDLSQMEAGELTLDRKEFGLSELLYDVMRLFAPAARQKGLTLLLDLDKSLPAAVIGDHRRFRQILINLIDNAIKFTDTGGITLQGVPVYHSDEVVGLHFVVSDTGRGIAADRFERAVQPFGQWSAVNKNPIGGTGLGLAITSRLIGMIGGCLWAEKAPGPGSVVHFTATFGKSNNSRLSPDYLGHLPGASILIADDSTISQRSIQQLLSRWQVKATLAASWPEALELLRRTAAGGTPFEVLLVDRPFLGVDGSELAKAISENPELGAPEVVVLHSCNPISFTDLTSEIRPRGHLVKPVSEFTLLKAVSTAVTAVNHKRIRKARESLCEVGKTSHILVADDDVLTQAVTVNILRREGFRVSLARNGTEAVAAFDRSGLDLVLMDVQMPDMDGLDATRLIRIRESVTGGHVPILAVTAHAMTGDRDRCLAAGMDDYVSKPCTPSHLRDVVYHWLDSSRDPVPAEPTAVAAVVR